MILVTGGTGFLGREVVKQLVKKGHKVRLLTRDPKEAKKIFPRLEMAKGNITDRRSLGPALRGVDTVVHLAGLVSYSKPKAKLMRVNLEGTKNLLAHCQKVKKFIFSGSVGVMGEIKGVADESYPTNPRTPYAESKLLAEKAVLESGIPALVFRIAPVYGIGSPSWLKNLKLLEKGFPIPKTDNLTHVVHVSDVAQAFELGVKKGIGVFLIADSKPVKFTVFVGKLLKLLGKEPKRMSFWAVKLAAKAKGMGAYLGVLTMNRNYSIERAREKLGYRPRADFDKELKRMVDWYKELKAKGTV